MYVHIIAVITCRGRAVTNVGRTCGPTPLLAIYAIKYVYTILSFVWPVSYPNIWQSLIFAYKKTMVQISCAAAQRLCFRYIVQSLFFLNPKFKASIHLLWLYSPVCVGPGWKPWRQIFLSPGSFITNPHQTNSRHDKRTIAWPNQ